MIKLIILSIIILTIACIGIGIGIILSNGKKNKGLIGSCGGSKYNKNCCQKNNKCKK